MQSEFVLHISCSANRKIRQLSFDQNINIGDDIASNIIPENEGCYIIANKAFFFFFYSFFFSWITQEIRTVDQEVKAKEKYSKSSAVKKMGG